MGNQTVSVLCGTCKVSVEGSTEPKPDDIMTCPNCGRADSFKNVMASVEKHSLELMERKFQESLKSDMRGCKIIKIESKSVPKRSYPFITDLKL